MTAPAAAEEFTGQRFLEWSQEAQHSFVGNSISMTWMIARQSREDIADCIDEWYSFDANTRKQRRGFVIDSIAEYPTYHPQAVLLATIQKRCGEL